MSILDFSEVVERTIASVGYLINGDDAGTGSCWAYSEDLLVTNAHVVSGKSAATARIRGRLLPVELIGFDSRSDIAILATSQPQRPLVIGAPPRLGSMCLTIGSPRRYPDSVSLGIVSGLNRSVYDPDGAVLEALIQTDCAINPGSSGGPIINLNGEVIAMATLGRTDSQGLSYGISSEMIEFVVPRLIKNETILHAQLGVLLAETIDERGSLSVRVVRPMQRESVFQVRDTITAIGGQPIKRRVDVWYALADLGKKKTIEVEVLRAKRKVLLRAPNVREDEE